MLHTGLRLKLSKLFIRGDVAGVIHEDLVLSTPVSKSTPISSS